MVSGIILSSLDSSSLQAAALRAQVLHFPGQASVQRFWVTAPTIVLELYVSFLVTERYWCICVHIPFTWRQSRNSQVCLSSGVRTLLLFPAGARGLWEPRTGQPATLLPGSLRQLRGSCQAGASGTQTSKS